MELTTNGVIVSNALNLVKDKTEKLKTSATSANEALEEEISGDNSA